MADRFSGLKDFIYGDENEKSKPSGVLEQLDAYTGAPTRSAIAKLQEDFTDLPGAAQAAYEQFGASPKTAPTGQDLAKNMRLEGLPAAAAGMGLELIADPSNLVSGGVKLAAMPLIGLKGLKTLDTVGDMARLAKAADTGADALKGVNAVEKAAKLAQEAKAAENLATFAGKTRNAASAAEQIKAMNRAKAIAEANEIAKAAELAKQEAGISKLAKELKVPESAKLTESAAPLRPTPLEDIVARPDTVFTDGKFGKIIVKPSRFEKLQASMKSKGK